jgi:hypothetical protein
MDQSGLEQAEFLWKNPDPESDGVYRARDYQWCWWRCEDEQQIDQGARSMGKALALDTPIKTPDGWTVLATLRPGSDVFGVDGRPIKVLSVSEIFTDHECFEIEFGDGTRIVADGGHLWPCATADGVGLLSTSELAAAPGASIPLHPDGEVDVVTVTPVDPVPVRCIKVDAEDGLFLVGPSMIPTHNSEGIMARVLAFPFSFPGLEQALVAPQKKHLRLISNRIEGVINQSRFYKPLLKQGVRDGITHDPFEIFWWNGATLASRLPGLDGKGLKGLHPVRLEVDEGQDISDDAYSELPTVVRREIKGWRWMIHGVSKGIIDKFYHYTQPGSGFTVHRPMAMDREDWNDEIKEQYGREYGGIDSPDYLRNVYGEHAGQANRIVVLARLYACTDTEEGSHYNSEEYKFFDLTPERVQQEAGVRRIPGQASVPIEQDTDEYAAAIRRLLTFPKEHLAYKGQLYWGGMDVGLVADPSEILISVEYTPEPKEVAADKKAHIALPLEGLSRLKLLTRIRLSRMPPWAQAEVVMSIMDFYKCRTFALDSTGNGLAVFRELQRRGGAQRFEVLDFTEDAPEVRRDDRAKAALASIRGYNFSGKILVGFDDSKLATLDNPTDREEMIKKAGIFRFVKDEATDQIRSVVDDQRYKFPFDDDVINDINAQTWSAGSQPAGPRDGERRYTYCVDEQTQALTRDRGWVDQAQLEVGDQIMGLDPATMTSSWTDVLAVNRFDGEHDMVLMENTSFSAFCTTNHRWFVERLYPYYDELIREFRTADELTTQCRIPRSAFCSALPRIAQHTDDFVELVAWFYTEGSWHWAYLGPKGQRRPVVGNVNEIRLSQSETVNADKTQRIRDLLTRLLGPPGRLRDGHSWHESKVDAQGIRTFRVSRATAEKVMSVLSDLPTKTPSRDFILSLTQEQLELFVKVSVMADGFQPPYGGPVFVQKERGRAEAFELAALLAGFPVSSRPIKQNGRPAHRVSILTTDHAVAWPGMHGRQRCIYETSTYRGVVWCPTTSLGTWLARRRGTTYFTGNSAGTYHILDALRMQLLGRHQTPIEAMLAEKPKKTPVLALFGV